MNIFISWKIVLHLKKKYRSNPTNVNLDEEQTLLKTLTTDTYDSLNKVNSLENITLAEEYLNL